MIRCWPVELLQGVYEDLVELWHKQEIPNAWQCRWVQLIPKKDDPGLADLRPLCLLEVLRKLWTRIFVGRITKFLTATHGMEDGQHCGKGRGTNSGFAATMAMLQTAKAHRSKLYVSSWDVQRAFDSVAKGVLKFGLIRLGVPEPLAEFISLMDRQAEMFIRTPLALLVH